MGHAEDSVWYTGCSVCDRGCVPLGFGILDVGFRVRVRARVRVRY